MSTPEKREPHHKFIKSGHLPPPPPSSCKKPRSQSLTPDRDEKLASSNDETAPASSTKKLEFAEIRKKFENQKHADVPTHHVYKKRTSVPASSITQTNTSHISAPCPAKAVKILTTHFNQSNDSNTTETTLVKPSVFSRSKSGSPSASSDGTNGSAIKNILRVSMNRMMNSIMNSSIEENENLPSPSPSPLPKSDDSPSLPENDNQQSTSVRKIREKFDGEKRHHYYQPSVKSRDSPPISKSSSSSFASNNNEPPSRWPPRPEHFLKSQSSDWHSVQSLDTADSVTGDDSLSSNPIISRHNSSDASFSDEEEDYEAERQTKLRRCLEEVNATEKTYVNILYVLSVKLSAEIKNTCDKDDNLILTFNNTYKPLLGTIQQIYQLHYGMIAPEIEEYIIGQRTGNMWSVLEKNFKVIEVLYKNYYVSYADIQGKLDELCRNNPLINEAMIKCQTYLGNLYPITQLNCPNQRLLRYILCMKTYLKYLDENSAEHKHTRSIHDELDRIAGRCEEELLISPTQLNELKERLDNKFECFKEQRKLMWHGQVKKVSPRRHADIAQRYMILFSDCILVCSEESGRKLEIKRELSMRGITIDVVQTGRPFTVPSSDPQANPTTYYQFRVNAVEKSYEFLVEKESERELWVKKIRQVTDDYNNRNQATEMRHSIRQQLEEPQPGTRAPIWVNDVDVSRCQNCNNRFRTTIILSRRHHCRCCGRCVCGSCSTKKLTLEYCKTEADVRVCDTCYTSFTGHPLAKNSSIWPKTTRHVDQTILFGDFRSVSSGTLVWIALQEDFQLHVFGAKLDEAEDYCIILSDLLDLQFEAETRKFELKETTKNHSFAIDSNHQITYPKSDFIDEQLKTTDSKLTFYANLWHEAMQLARSTTLPDWYIRKRDSTDSGVSNVG
ncbi:unnamed protein product [Rotaria socialis]|uniref:Uncharacterized protein n=2 Tax=Rotaria socialis TaxID=392032 RepID=A0A820KWF3_9BILA|nr:unnamed protein product [Rotaria socialis]CAF4348491.1 unnamed protein product [Rotaria socialis]